MKSQIATTKKQSLRLLSCGVSPDTADMIGVEPDYGYECEPWSSMQGQDTRGYFPAWSLSRLLELLPKEICDENSDSYYFSLAQEYPSNADYRAAYKYYSVDECDYVGRRSSQPIEACVQLIEWLTENDYKLNEQ